MRIALQCLLLFVTLWAIFAPGSAQGGVATNTTTESTTHHTTTTVDPDAHLKLLARGYLVTVRGFLERSGARDIVFMKSLESSPGLSPVREVVEQARQAVLDAGAARILPLQELVGEVLPPAQSSTLEEVERTQQQTATAGVTVGPNTIMIGEDMSQAFFVPAGTVNTNINIHTETFVRQREVTTTTLTKTASLDVIGTP